MRPKSGLPKRKALRRNPEYVFGFKDNPAVARICNPSLRGCPLPNAASVLSMFCGCGGLDLGMLGGFRCSDRTYEPLAFQIVDALDNDPHAIEAYRLNIGHHGRVADLTQVEAPTLPSADVLAGGFPCQDFSSSGPKVGLDGKRGRLYMAMVNYMRAHRPLVVLGENVPYLKRLDNGVHLSKIIGDLEAVGYRFDTWELYGPDYGLPQSRRRLFLVGVRDDLPGAPMQPTPTHLRKRCTISDAIGDLESISDETITNQSQYFVALRATSGGGQGDHTNRRNDVAYCIRANAKARIQFHYALDRRLTVRECARLQTFPDEFVFPFAAMNNMTLIGNAVPPLLGHCVAKRIAEYLSKLQSSEGRRALKREAVLRIPASLYAGVHDGAK